MDFTNPVAPRVVLNNINTTRSSLITYINTSNVIAVTDNREVFVHSLEDQVTETLVFKKHGGSVTQVLHLCQDILVSVDDKGNLFSWDAESGAVLGEFKKDHHFHSAEKLGNDTLLVGATGGKLFVLSHREGRNFVEEREVIASPFSEPQATVNSIFVHGDIIISLYVSNYACISKTCDFGKVSEINQDKCIRAAALNDRSLVVGCDSGKLIIYKNHSSYEQIGEVDLFAAPEMSFRKSPFHQLLFITDDLLLVSTYTTGIFFVSLSKKSTVANLYPGYYTSGNNLKRINRPTCIILNDGRICVEGSNSCCIFDPPPIVAADVKSYADQMLSQSRKRNAAASKASSNRPKSSAYPTRNFNGQILGQDSAVPIDTPSPDITSGAVGGDRDLSIDAVEDGHSNRPRVLRLLEGQDAGKLYKYEVLNAKLSEQKGETNILKAQMVAMKNELNSKITSLKDQADLVRAQMEARIVALQNENTVMRAEMRAEMQLLRSSFERANPSIESAPNAANGSRAGWNKRKR